MSVCHWQVEEADQIYLLMKEEYRISRNVRLAWFLGKLNQVIWPASKPELVSSLSSCKVEVWLKVCRSCWGDCLTQSLKTNYLEADFSIVWEAPDPHKWCEWWISDVFDTHSWAQRMNWTCWVSYLKDGRRTSPPPCTPTCWCPRPEPPSWPGGTASSSSWTSAPPQASW